MAGSGTDPSPTEGVGSLLGNHHLHAEREHLHAAMARWLVRSKQPVIIIDWSDLKADRSWHLLRAGSPVGGRTLTVLDMVFPKGKQGSLGAEKRFLQRLAAVLPENVCPIPITDAGFRGPWFRAAEAMGWHWLGRLRNTTQVKPADAPDTPDEWVSCKAMYAQYMGKTRDFGVMDVARSLPLAARRSHRAPRQAAQRAQTSQPPRHCNSRKGAQRVGEPRLLMASTALDLTVRQIVALYTRRMQIELSFRDLKTHRYG